jgi:chorismate mutase-like protein
VKELLPFRKRIDAIDRKIIALLVERAKLARKIGAVKKQHGLPIYEPAREVSVLERVEGYRKEPLPAAGLARIYRAIMLTMRGIQK